MYFLFQFNIHRILQRKKNVYTKMEGKISAKALGILFLAWSQNQNISAENLSSYFTDGEKSMATGLKQLRVAGYITTQNLRLGNGTFAKNTRITDEGVAFLLRLLVKVQTGSEAWALMLFTSQDKALEQGARNLANLTALAGEEIYPVISPDGPKELYSELEALEQEEFEEKRYREKLIERQRAFAEEEIAKKNRRMLKRHAKSMKDWTATDSSFEFAEQMHRLWDVPPWRVTQSRLAPAISACRLKYDTDGELEYFMIEKFFKELVARKNAIGALSGELCWKFFIQSFPRLAAWAKIQAPTQSRLSEWDWYYESIRFMNLDLKDDFPEIEFRIAHKQSLWCEEAQKMGLTPSDPEYLSRKKAIRLQIEEESLGKPFSS